MEELDTLANDFGTIDIRSGLPDYVRWHNNQFSPIFASRVEIPFREALTGFEKVRGKWIPVLRGIVVPQTDSAKLKRAINSADLWASTWRQRRFVQEIREYFGGYLEIFTRLPSSLQHIEEPRVQLICRKLDIPFVTVKEYGGFGNAKNIGVLVASRDASVVNKAIHERKFRRTSEVLEKERIYRQERQKLSAFDIATMIRRLYPRMPEDEEYVIAEWTTTVGSGRVGRSRQLSDEEIVDLAVSAHVRHNYTDFTEMFQYHKTRFRKHRIRNEDPAAHAFEDIRNKSDDILTSWSSPPPTVEAKKMVELIVGELAHKLADAIANNPDTLLHVEHRDVERLFADVFSRIGFDVELTPGSGDGGRDIILKCLVKGHKQKYLIEIKHWQYQRVHKGVIQDFIKVVAKEENNGGVILSTSGFTSGATAEVTAESRRRPSVYLKGRQSMVMLCQLSVRVQNGLVLSKTVLPKVLTEKELPI